MHKWIVPFNVKKFDLITHFSTNETVFIKRNRAISNSDEVYIYLSTPFSEVRYKCIVIKTGIKAEVIPPEYKVSRLEDGFFVEIKLLGTFPEKLITGQKLKQLGLGQFINQQSVYGQIEQYLIKCEEMMLKQ